MFLIRHRVAPGAALRRTFSAATATATTASTAAPLMAGMKVVELANVLAGPTVCQFLAELGADVVKVENTTTKGDVTRTWRLPSDDDGEPDVSTVTAYFSCCNLGKRSVALDLRDPRGIDVVHRMVEDADVVVASYKPGDAEKLRVDYETLSRINPSLVFGQITGYGLDDDRAGYDAVIQAESGFQYMNGEAAPAPPTKMPVALTDLLAAHQLKEGILASLWRRERTGTGSFVSVSLMSAAVSALANQATGYLKAGAVPERIGSDHPSICPYGTVFECADGGLIALAVGSDRQFATLCAVLGRPEVARDERYRTNPARVRHRDECKGLVRDLIAAVDRPTLLRELRDSSVPAGGVNTMADVFEQPQAESLVVRDAVGAPLGVRQVAFVESGVGDGGEAATLLPPPEYAEHARDVLSRYLSPEEIDRLIEDSVVEQR